MKTLTLVLVATMMAGCMATTTPCAPSTVTVTASPLPIWQRVVTNTSFGLHILDAFQLNYTYTYDDNGTPLNKHAVRVPFEMWNNFTEEVPVRVWVNLTDGKRPQGAVAGANGLGGGLNDIKPGRNAWDERLAQWDITGSPDGLRLELAYRGQVVASQPLPKEIPWRPCECR